MQSQHPRTCKQAAGVLHLINIICVPLCRRAQPAALHLLARLWARRQASEVGRARSRSRRVRGQTRCRGTPRLKTGRSQVWSRPGRQRCRGRGCMRCRAIPRFELGYALLWGRPGRQRRRGRGRGRGRGDLPGQQRHRAGVAPSGGASRARVASRARSVCRACGRYARLHARARVEVGRPAWRARCAPGKPHL